MRSNLGKVMAALAIVALAASVQAQAQHSVTTRADGSVTVVMDEEQFTIPAPVAEAVELAVAEYADDPEALRQAIRDIVSDNAADAGEADFATAIAALAVFHAGPSSAAVAAIGIGVTQGNGSVSGGAVIAAIPALRSEPGPEEAAEQELVRVQATVENPSQVSPVQ